MAELCLEDLFPCGQHEGEQIEDVIEDFPQYMATCMEYDSFDFAEDVLEKLRERKLI